MSEVIARYQKVFDELAQGRWQQFNFGLRKCLIVGHGTALGSILPLYGSNPKLGREEVRKITM